MKTKVVFTIMLLMLVALVPAVSAQEESLNTDEASKMVSVEQAEKIASFSIKEISGSIADLSEWKDATVKLSTVYYDLDGKKSAYSFNVIKNKQQVGCILISATKDNSPVLEFSKGKVTNEITELTSRSKSLVQERANEIKSESTDKEELTVGEMKPLYLGPTFYYAEYNLTDNRGKTKEKVTVDLASSTIVNFNKSNVSIPVGEKDYFYNSTYLKQQQEIRKQNANIQWTTLEKEMADSSSYSAASSVDKKISGVPYYLWRDGCSPTAAGMVLGYWDTHGYSNFPGETTLIDNLANAMGTEWPGDGSTWPWNIDDGIVTVCQKYKYPRFTASNDYLLTWTKVKNEVNANRPFVLSMQSGGIGSGWSQAYGDHSVTCMGYYDGSIEYVYIHDTWNKNTHYLGYGSWSSAMATWVKYVTG
jgi:hypothetical protein